MTPMRPAPFYMTAAQWGTAAAKAKAEAPQGSVDFVRIVGIVAIRLEAYGESPFAFVLSGEALPFLCDAARALGLPHIVPPTFAGGAPLQRHRPLADAAREATDFAYSMLASEQLREADDRTDNGQVVAYDRAERYSNDKPWRTEADWSLYSPRDKREWAALLEAVKARGVGVKVAKEVPAE